MHIRIAERLGRFRRHLVIGLTAWTICIAFLYGWQVYGLREGHLELIRSEARSAFFKDLIIRRWNAQHGGVYAEIKGATVPNLYLDAPEKVISTPSGKQLTLINPAYMTRQVHELQQETHGILGHITSLKPIRPENAPDHWETEALRAFEQGAEEVSTVASIDDTRYMRLMRPLITEQGCLQCHARQGYRVGDVRGGISVSVPLSPHLEVLYEQVLKTSVGHFLIWALGAGLLTISIISLADSTQHMERSEKTTRCITDSAREAIIMIDEKGAVNFWNPRAVEMFGYTADEAYGRDVHTLIAPGRYTDRIREGLAMYLREGKGAVLNATTEMTALRRDGSEFPVEVAISPVTLHGRRQAVGMIKDITRRKQYEVEIIRAREDAEAANRAKSEFLANMSHEIRTPMNGIMGMTELILLMDLTKEQREYLRIVGQSAESLHDILNDILDYSKIEAGRMELDNLAFNLRTLAESTVQTLAALAHRKGLELNCRIAPDTPVHLMGDPARLRQVLINLIGNAIKFTERGQVSLHIEPSPDSPETGDEARPVTICFIVSDTGIGIEKDKADKIFESFVQADASTTRKYGGTGLGLSISREIVRLMGGTITVHSSAGHGSDFLFTAKFVPGEPCVTETFTGGRNLLVGKQILIVDDNTTNRYILKEMLEPQGATVKDARSGAEAIEELLHAHRSGAPYDLALLDYQMPGMDGIGLLERIREFECLGSLRSIMLTSGALLGDADRARALGVSGFLSKPVRYSDIMTEILSALHIRPLFAAETGVVMPEGSRYRILVAEDNDVNRKLAMTILERAGYCATAVRDGAEVLKELEAGSYDLVLMDVQMPVMDGLETTKRIRSMGDAPYREIPIIAVTARAMKGDRELCLGSGMDSYISKPMRSGELINAIEEVMKGHSMRNRNDERDTSPVSEAPVLDVAGAMERLGGDADLMKLLYRTFLDETPQTVRELELAVGRADMKGVREAAHSVKSAAAAIGAMRVSELARGLEYAGRDGDALSVRELHPSFEEAFLEIVVVLREKLGG